MRVEEKLEDILQTPLEGLGYEIVHINLQGVQKKVLEILIERIDRQPITLTDCTKVSREVSAHLDVADPIQSSYILEVSSPGMDRPLVKKKDFERFIEHEIKVRTYSPHLKNRKKFQGALVSVCGNVIKLCVESEADERSIVEIDISDIQSARLVAQFKE